MVRGFLTEFCLYQNFLLLIVPFVETENSCSFVNFKFARRVGVIFDFRVRHRRRYGNGIFLAVQGLCGLEIGILN